MNDKQLIFMATPFRSGSALTSRILNANSQIGMICDKLKYFRFCYNRYNPLTEDNVYKMLNDVAIRLHGRFEISINVEECFKEIESKTNCDASIYSTLLNHIFKETDKEIIGEVECLGWSKIPVFLDMFPNSKALLIIRDLRDVVVSFKKLTFAPGDDYLIALFNVIDAMDHFLEYQKKYPDRFYGIRYEALKSNPEQEIVKICHFLGINFETDMLDENNWTELKGNKWKNKAVSSFYIEGDHNNPVGRWRRLILPEDHYLCEWIGKAQLNKFGLETEGKGFTQDIIDSAVKKITSSKLLRESFEHWCETGKGVEKYPLDPTKPENWDLSDVKNPELFNTVS